MEGVAADVGAWRTPGTRPDGHSTTGNGPQNGGAGTGVMLFASLFAGFVVLYVSFFAKCPLDTIRVDDSDE